MDDGDDWIKLAMSDDSLVANLLLHLRHDTRPSPPPPRSDERHSSRKRRSNSRKRPVASGGKKGVQRRIDPASSAGESVLSGGDGFSRSAKPAAESSRPKDQSSLNLATVKHTATNERSKRKKVAFKIYPASQIVKEKLLDGKSPISAVNKACSAKQKQSSSNQGPLFSVADLDLPLAELCSYHDMP